VSHPEMRLVSAAIGTSCPFSLLRFLGHAGCDLHTVGTALRQRLRHFGICIAPTQPYWVLSFPFSLLRNLGHAGLCNAMVPQFCDLRSRDCIDRDKDIWGFVYPDLLIQPYWVL
jgi:hypothetical protein